MNGPHDITSKESITVDLTTDQIRRLDNLRAERNLSRGELLGELIGSAKLRRARRPDSDRQKSNPWGQVWPG
jgi:hypothetical protein